MYILGVAIAYFNDTPYKGTAINNKTGEIYVGIGVMESHRHQYVEKYIRKAHPELASHTLSSIPEITYGYIVIDEYGNKWFADSDSVWKAINLKEKHFVTHDYMVKWDNEPSYIYEDVEKEMRAMLKDEFGITEEDIGQLRN